PAAGGAAYTVHPLPVPVVQLAFFSPGKLDLSAEKEAMELLLVSTPHQARPTLPITGTNIIQKIYPTGNFVRSHSFPGRLRNARRKPSSAYPPTCGIGSSPPLNRTEPRISRHFSATGLQFLSILQAFLFQDDFLPSFDFRNQMETIRKRIHKLRFPNCRQDERNLPLVIK